MKSLKDNSNVPPISAYKSGPGDQAGKIGWLFLWLLGIPVPILLVLFLVRGCT